MSSTPAVAARARAMILLLALLAVGMLAARGARTAVPIDSRISDITTYHRMIDAIRAGTPYYEAIGGELRRWGYATREVFNWRTPLLMEFEARVSNLTSQRILVMLAVAATVGAFSVVTPWGWAAVAALMQLGMVALFAGSDSYVMGEPWAGVLIALSICAHRIGQRGAGVALGLLALFVRELAAPYFVVCVLIAGFERRRGEVATWIAGGVAYFLYFGWHVSNVLAHRLPTDTSHPASWLALGGMLSLVTKVYWQGWLILLPMWVTAVALAVIVAGIADGDSDRRTRAASAAYVVFFLVAGQTFDWYWGLVAWPTWGFVFAGGLRAIARALRTVAVPARAGAVRRP